MRPTLLVYNIETPRLQSLRVITTRLGIRVISVNPSNQNKVLGSFFQTELQTCEGGNAFTEEMMVLCGFDGHLMDIFLNELRRKRRPNLLKAALTSTNQNWNAMQLYEQIVREREEMKKSNP